MLWHELMLVTCQVVGHQIGVHGSAAPKLCVWARPFKAGWPAGLGWLRASGLVSDAAAARTDGCAAGLVDRLWFPALYADQTSAAVLCSPSL
jgi:hypothetical protein